MRRMLIAGNWKMNLNGSEARALAGAVADQFPEPGDLDIAVFPPAVWLEPVRQAIAGSAVGLGAQNVSPESNGAFTGEISAGMLLDAGCQYVIVGHSERRTLYGETDGLVNAKAQAALRSGLVPVVCLGETLEQREAGQTGEVIRRQFQDSLAGISASDIQRLVIAYEPVWAIGTGRVASGEQAQEVHADLRKLLQERYNSALASGVRILYGGSVKPDNAGDLLGRPDIDGALVGGASLDAENFVAIARHGLAARV